MKKSFMLSVLSFLISCNLRAETLQEVLSDSYENNLTVNAERAAQRAVDEGVAKAKSGYRPYITAEGNAGRSYNKLDYVNPLMNDGEEYYQNPMSVQVKLTQPIFSGLSTVNSVKAAKNQVKAGRNALLTAEQTILLNTVAVYMDVIRDKAVLELQENQEKVLKEHLASYRKRLKAGDLTRTDVAQSEARASGATAARIAAQGQLKVSEANFFSVLGKNPGELEDVKKVNFTLPETMEEALDLALKNNPKILAANYAKESAKYTVKAKKGILIPSVNVGIAAGRQKENISIDKDDYWQLQANLSVPLYQSGAEYADIRQAKQLENRYRILWNKVLQDVHAEVVAAWENYTASKAQTEAIKSQIKASKMALQGVIREAKLGSRTVLDVLDAEQEYLDNQVALVKTHREEIVSAYSLISAIGQMNPTGLGLSVQAYDPKEYYESVKNKWIGYGID
ncbi:MAG: TolC family outer membrane protein [Alphaproteobacteria bacterium]|nr:TolC family outer membrane protein [Alphaproteobacteria bacterium]